MQTEAQINARHRQAAKRRQQVAQRQPATKPWRARKVTVRLEQNENGEWMHVINDGSPFLATDAEVALWLELQEALAALEMLRERAK